MKQTEIQRVLIDIDEHPGTDLDGIAERTGLGWSVVALIVDELETRRIVIDEGDQWAVTRIGDEIMAARTSEA